MSEQWKDAYGNQSTLGLSEPKDGVIPIPPKYNPLRHFFLCLLARHWWGVDDYLCLRVCARCGKFEQLLFDGKTWVSRKKWKKLNNIKD